LTWFSFSLLGILLEQILFCTALLYSGLCDWVSLSFYTLLLPLSNSNMYISSSAVGEYFFPLLPLSSIAGLYPGSKIGCKGSRAEIALRHQSTSGRCFSSKVKVLLSPFLWSSSKIIYNKIILLGGLLQVTKSPTSKDIGQYSLPALTLTRYETRHAVLVILGRWYPSA